MIDLFSRLEVPGTFIYVVLLFEACRGPSINDGLNNMKNKKVVWNEWVG